MGRSPKKKDKDEGIQYVTREEFEAERKRITDMYENQLAKMNENFKSLLAIVTEIRQEARERTNSTYSSAVEKGIIATIGPAPTPELIQYQAMKSIECNKRYDKDSNIVLVGVPTDIEDISASVKEVIREAHIVDTMVVDCFRHLTKDKKPSTIVKVKLNSTKDKSLLKKVLGSSNLCKFSRDDLTPIELQHDRNLRNWCHEQNQSIGNRLYIVRNLAVVKLENSSPKQQATSIPGSHVTTRRTGKPIASALSSTQ